MGSAPLHIGIDGSELLGHPTGVGRFLTEILRAWSAHRDTPHRFTLFLPGAAPASAPWLAPEDTRFTFVADPDNRPGTWWEQTRLPGLVARARVNVLLSPGYTAPIRLSCPSVLAVHDVSFFAHPEWFHWREGLRRRWLTKNAARRAHTVVTISKFSSGEIQHWLGVAPGRIQIVYPGPPVIRPTTGESRQPVVLFVGSLFTRRHIPELIRAFADVRARVPDAALVLVGDNRTSPREDPIAIAEQAGIRDRVTWRAYAPDDEVNRLYASARVFVFLSDYEGFAMTPLEALAHGVPSVLLDTEVAREIYGAAARYTNTGSGQIAGAIGDLLTDDTERARLLGEGQRLLQEYSWPRAAAQLLATLESAARLAK